MDTVIQSAQDKRFTDFSDAVKAELKHKLANNNSIKQFVSDYDKIQSLKDAFKEINSDNVPSE